MIIKFLATAAAITLLSLPLGGCPEHAQLIKEKYKVPNVPAALYNCPVLTKYPQISTLTDSEVARLLLKLQSNNQTCKNSLEGIRQFLIEAKKLEG